jgi:phosphoglycerol transferase
MRDRQTDNWQKLVAAKPAKGMLDDIALADFKGIYINRILYNDGGAGIESELSTLLGSQPIVSDNQRLSFYSLLEYQKKLKSFQKDTSFFRKD